MDQWTVNTNEATDLALVNDKTNIPFKPTFTYPIFGEQELIYGYENLHISVEWHATSLIPLVDCKFDRKLPNAQNDPKETILEFFDEQDTCTSRQEWLDRTAQPFTIPGKRVASWENDSGSYAVYNTKISTPQGAQILKRIQPLVLFFIEAGSYIDSSDDTWELYLVYKEDPNSGPVLCAFATLYSYFYYKNAESHDSIQKPSLKRQRISQFVVLPPFQNCRVGANLYSSLYDLFLADPDVTELTVEDPSEAFDDLRDRCDLKRLLADPKFSSLRLPLDADTLENMREKYKMVPRQFHRCVEMALLMHYTINAPKQYRLFVKKRLYIRNREVLDEMDAFDRKAKLAETYDALIHDYARIIAPLSQPAKRSLNI